MNAVCEGHQCVNIVFDRIITEPGWDNDAIAQAMALKQKLQDFKFMFLLDVFRAIFGHTNVLIYVLQARSLDLRRLFDYIDATLNSLKALRTDTTLSVLLGKRITEGSGAVSAGKTKDLTTASRVKIQASLTLIDLCSMKSWMQFICQMTERFSDMK